MSKNLDIKKLTGIQKVAMILLAVKEENATKIFSLMKEEEIKNISRAISNLGSIHPSNLQILLDNLAGLISGEIGYLSNIKNTEKLLSKVLSKDQVSGLMEEITGPQGSNTWEKLKQVNEELLASYLKGEHPQTIALVISKLAPDHAAKVIGALPESIAFESMTRIINLGSVKKDILDHVEKILRNQFLSTITKTQKYDSYEMLAEIFNSLDRATESKYMGMLEKNLPDSAERVKNLMFTFNDLVKIGPAGVQVLLRFVNKDQLTIAMKGASEKVKDLFLKNMTKRASKILMEELEALGPTRVKDVDAAQSAIVTATKDLIAKGEIKVSDDASEEYI